MSNLSGYWTGPREVSYVDIASASTKPSGLGIECQPQVDIVAVFTASRPSVRAAAWSWKAVKVCMPVMSAV
ncbi:hypothetical protein [Nonomuraea sp. NPDC049158]|uniref:hypothetical protein n=1 Tax=Nonomuraea sp. NPDC049158 TaxID=3155649 RepID=UPI0033DFDD59